MGNHFQRMAQSIPHQQEFTPVEAFKFHDSFAEEDNNGLCLNGIYLPEEVLTTILSFVQPKEILSATLVCKKWCNIIKSNIFWCEVYSRCYNKKPQKLPWYVYYALFSTDYFDTNLIKNGNGEEKFAHWKITKNYGDQFRIEKTPVGADLLPLEVPEFHGHTSCFATSYYECLKTQTISFENNRLMQKVLSEYKPHIYVSEWMSGRFDCGCVYHLRCYLYGDNRDVPKTAKHNLLREDTRETPSDLDDDEWFDDHEYDEEVDANVLHKVEATRRIDQWAGRTWEKVEMIVSDYPAGVKKIIFEHEGKDTQFWKGHYGSKMAGGVLKILFDSIRTKDEN